MSESVSCNRCGSERMQVVQTDDERPALWCADCEEPVEYEDGGQA